MSHVYKDIHTHTFTSYSVKANCQFLDLIHLHIYYHMLLLQVIVCEFFHLN